MAETGKLKPGMPAPPFALLDQEGRRVSLASLIGSKVLVYFYPKADTPGCTRQACAVRDALDELKSRGVKVVGISPDPITSQERFARKYKLNFPLLSDTDHEVAKAYGVWGEKKRYGKTVLGITRSAFLVDEHGRIAASWYGIKPEETVPRVLKFISQYP